MSSPAPLVWLTRGDDLAPQIDTLAAAHGGRAGIDSVLDNLSRTAVVVDVPSRTASYGFRWDDADLATPEWWPQGVTTSADATDTDDINGRRVVAISWYAKGMQGKPSRGSRVSFVDVSDLSRPRYRHVMLVRPAVDDATGEVVMKPVRVHAGGLVWYGPSILVADTKGGLRTFQVDDILALSEPFDGYDYVLPQRTAYQASTADGATPFRWSFVSVDRTDPGVNRLVAGEYGVGDQTKRLVTFAFDAGSEALAMTDGAAHPLEVLPRGASNMQGATVIDGSFYFSTSRGTKRCGTMVVRRADGRQVSHRAALAIGPEDLAYWPQRDEIWNVSEHPGKRYVYAMPRPTFDISPLQVALTNLRHLFS